MLLALEKMLVHKDLEEVRLNTRMLEEAVQPAVGKLGQLIDYLELERICSAAGHLKEVRYRVKGRVEQGAASCFGQLVVWRQVAEHKHLYFLTMAALIHIAAADRQLMVR